MLDKIIVHAVESVIGKAGDKPILLHVPLIDCHEKNNAVACITSGHLSAGTWTDKFETEFKKFIGAKHCIATSSGTAALHVVVHALDLYVLEISIPSLIFIAAANALSYDSCQIEFTDYGQLCDISVPIIGHPVKDGAIFIDAAQALGSSVSGKYIGSSGTAVFSFNQNKPITGGAGGCIVTDDTELAVRLKHLTTTARIPDRFRVEHDAIGYNYRMSDVTAAILCAQVEKLPLILKAKRALAHKYQEQLDGLRGVKFWEEPKGTESNFWLPSIVFDSHDEQMAALWALNNAGISARMLPTPMHLLAPYKDCPRTDMMETERLWKTTVCLPGSPSLGLKYL